MSEIDKPDHYAHIGGVYPIDISEHLPHCLGAALEYLWRAGKKQGQPEPKDMRKAAWYLRRFVADPHAHVIEGAPTRVDILLAPAVLARKAVRDGGATSSSPLHTMLCMVASGEPTLNELAELASRCDTIARTLEAQ